MCEPTQQDLLNIGYQTGLPFDEAKAIWVNNVTKKFHVFNIEALHLFFETKIWANNYTPKTQQQIMKVSG